MGLKRSDNIMKFISAVTLVCFALSSTVGYAQSTPALLPAPGTMVQLSQAFEPAMMAGIQVSPKDPFQFNFIISRGETLLSDEARQEEYQKLLKYFLVSLTVPNMDMWVNLSPYEADRIIPDNFAMTEMGRDLLAQDYLLKQITSSLIYPEGDVGKKFWQKVYRTAYEKYGTTDIPLDTFNKVWIVPDKAVVYEKNDTALAIKSHLKVMLETDYLATSHASTSNEPLPTGGHVAPQADTLEGGNVSPSRLPTSQPLNMKATQGDPATTTLEGDLSKEVMRQVVIPALEQEVNEGQNFALLRQIYSSMLMATWFKKALRQSILGQAYADKSKVTGVELNDPQAKERIYQQYLEAYKKGVFNFIKEEEDPLTQEVIPRKYFSGGAKAFTEDMIEAAAQSEAVDFAQSTRSIFDRVRAMFTSNVTGQANPSSGLKSGLTFTEKAPGSVEKAGKIIPGAPLKSQKGYNRDVELKERSLKNQSVIDPFIAPGREGFEKFKPLYEECRSIIDRLLTAQGLDPKEFQFFLADTVDPNAYAVNYYNTIVVNLGLVRMLVEYAKANNISVTQDALAWVLSHELLHVMQNRREIDEGRFDEKKGLVDRHVEDRGKEYQSDLLALGLMDRGGFSVKAATHILQGIDHWLTVRSQKDGFWGTHPQLEERFRKLYRQILTFHWQNQDVPPTALNSVALAGQRTWFREFQERVINVQSAADLVSLVGQAKTISELHFAVLVGGEVLGRDGLSGWSDIMDVFERRSREFAGEDQAKQVLFDYMKNEVYLMLGLRSEPRLDSFKALASTLSIETIMQILELGAPDIFSLSVDVDSLDQNEQHEKARAILQRLNTSVTSMVGRSLPSNRFSMYATGFLDALYARVIDDARKGELELIQTRRFLKAILTLQSDSGYSNGMWFTRPIQDMLSTLVHSAHYRGQLTGEDIRLIIRTDETLGTRVNYAVSAGDLAKELYALAGRIAPDVRKEIMDWLLREDRGWNQLRAEFIKLDIQAVFKGGRSLIFEGTPVDYLEGLLANNNIVRNMRDVLKFFVEVTHTRANNISSEDLVAMHRKIFSKFKEEHIDDDLRIFWYLWINARHSPGMFSGDAFDRAILESIPSELRPLFDNMRRELKPIFYVMALGGIPEGAALRDFVFGGIRYRERRNESIFSDAQVQALIASLAVKRGAPETFDSIEDRYDSLEDDGQRQVNALWDRLNPMRDVMNIDSHEFGSVKRLLEYYRSSLGQGLADKDSTREQQEEAFGRYAAPFYLQALFVERGVNVRLREKDVRFSSNAWDVFAGEISQEGLSTEARYAELASKQRPRNAVRFMKEGIAFDDFVKLFDFIALLPQDFEAAVDVVVQGIPLSVFRNFLLHRLFVDRVLVGATGYSADHGAIFNFAKIQEHIARLPADQRRQVLSAVARIAPYFVHDGLMEKSNEVTAAVYWRERYSSKAPQLDEAAIRREHGQEIGHYEDMLYTVPGGPVAQLSVFISRLADDAVRDVVSSGDMTLAAKRESIERYYPQASLPRDRWIKAAIESQGREKSVDEIEKLLAMIQNMEMRDNLALGAFDQYRSKHPDEFGSLGDALQKIQRFFPKASLIRDDILMEIAQFLAKLPEQYEQVRALYLDPFKKIKDLDLKETARTAMNADMFRSWMTGRSPVEKADFLLWLMGVTDEKPFFLVDFEYNFHVNADSMREDFGRKQSKYYPFAGQSSQREALEPFLYGGKGVLDDPVARKKLLDGILDQVLEGGAKKPLMRKIFDKVFEKADQFRREEIFLSLVWALSLQRGETQGSREIIGGEKEEARATRMFLESLGLIGRQVAQVLARSVWVSKAMREELSRVQDNARRMDKGVVFDMLEKFGLLERFESIEEPVGSAKVAGVYRAKMRDGRIVALKVKRSEVDKMIESDMRFLGEVFDDDLQSFFRGAGIDIPANFIDQIEASFRQELDFKQEARNTTELGARVQRPVLKRIKEFSLRKLFGDTRLGDVQGDYEFYVPEIIETVNNSLIIMEYIDGIPLSSEARVKEAGLDQKDIEQAVANELLREVFYEGFYHGDPHLGNIFVRKLKNGRIQIILIDAGASFELTKTNRRLLGKLMTAIRDNDGSALEEVVRNIGGDVGAGIKIDFKDRILGSNDSVGQKLLWFFNILETYKISMPDELMHIMRFFATGQALFDHGNSGPVGSMHNDAAQADELNKIIDQAPDQAMSGDGRFMGLVFDALNTPDIMQLLPEDIVQRNPGTGTVLGIAFLSEYGYVGDQLKRLSQRTGLEFEELRRVFHEKLLAQMQKYAQSSLGGRDILRLCLNRTANALDVEYARRPVTAGAAGSAVLGDRAMVENPGGIDLNEDHLDLEIRRDADGVPLSFEAQDPALLNIRGLTPVIINIQPVGDLKGFLMGTKA